MATRRSRVGRVAWCFGPMASAESISGSSWRATMHSSPSGRRRLTRRAWLAWCRCTLGARPGCPRPSWRLGCSAEPSSICPGMAPHTGAAASSPTNSATCRSPRCSASGASTELRPHRLDTHMVSNDPDFETKAANVIGLYLDPPAHAAVFCVDEKTAIQALDRKDRMLPLSPGRAERHGFECKRNGTLSLCSAALSTRALARCWARRLRAAPASSSSASSKTSSPLSLTDAISTSICDQREQPQDAPRAGVLGRASARPYALHADVLVLVEPGRERVCPHPARRPSPGASSLASRTSTRS